MSQKISGFVPASCDLLAIGEPTHQEPAFALVRNNLFAQLAGQGFRSIALETDRVAALIVNDYVQDGVGDLDAVLRDGFSHGFGQLPGNRELVTWMREYNAARPPAQRLAFHGCDISTEMFSAPSPRRYLEYTRDYLGQAFDPEIADLAGDDERWSRVEAIMDPASSPGATAEARMLRCIADDLLTMLYMCTPELIGATSREDWFRAQAHVTAGLGLLRYHRQSAEPAQEENARISRLMVTRDALIAQNLLDLRLIEAQRGPTLVFAQNGHLQRNLCHWDLGGRELSWNSAGAIVSPLLGERYVFAAGSLGRSDAIGLGEPGSGTFEALLQRHFPAWGLTPAAGIATAARTATPRTRTDITPQQGYFPLTQAGLDSADLILHIGNGTAASAATPVAG
jgi:erythromycin esterase-like protein